MDVILETPGTRISKKQELIKLDVFNAPSVEIPLREIESIIVDKSVQVTSQALYALASNAVNIVYTSFGKPFGLFTPFASVGTVFTRRQQTLAYDDWRGLHMAIRFVYSTIENKRRLLLYLAKNRKKAKPGKSATLRAAARKLGAMIDALLKFSKTKAKGERIANVRMELMGIEGKAAAIYFTNYGIALPKDIRTFERTRRPPQDPVNSLLSLGYTLLQGHVTTAIAAAGLELYGGFLHSDRSGKPSLALDLLEEFRQPIVDRFVVRLLQKGVIKKDDFQKTFRGYQLKDDPRKVFYKELRKEIMGGDTSQELFGNQAEVPTENETTKGQVRINYKKTMVKQARKVANFLIGATSEYQPFKMNW
ncbi:MAG: CRISPR-associated endonuclease Cas1 [Candidatus Lokiarchaeota archaeon]|nr:CRISPR-associated endonuclease Cas1 [Candidatus Lokiarchaeota archaeon]